MAKKKQEVSNRYSKEGFNALLEADTFIYEVDIYKMAPPVYNLEDSKTISAKSYVADKTDYFKKDDIQFRRVSTLIAAPIKWLNENKYQLCQDQQKTQ